MKLLSYEGFREKVAYGGLAGGNGRHIPRLEYLAVVA